MHCSCDRYPTLFVEPDLRAMSVPSYASSKFSFKALQMEDKQEVNVGLVREIFRILW